MGVFSSPLLLDLFGLGYPDLLSGSKEWKNTRAITPISHKAYRNFDLDLTSKKFAFPRLWEWVGPRTGILVHWPDAAPKDDAYPLTLDGSYLFGNHTFGRLGEDAWKHGYEPLATLDKDKNGGLSGAELTVVWVWLDANSNALVDKGEMKPSAEYVKSIAVVPTTDSVGNAEAQKGAELLNGKAVSTWDWWSRGWEHNPPLDVLDYSPEKGQRVRHRGVVLPPVTTITHPSYFYYWALPQANGYSGLLRFFKVGADTYVISGAASSKIVDLPGKQFYSLPFAKVQSTKAGLSWTFDLVFSDWKDSSKVLLSDIVGSEKLLTGEAFHDAADPKFSFKYSWVGEPVRAGFDPGTSNRIFVAMASFSEADFAKALSQNTAASLIFVPVPSQADDKHLPKVELKSAFNFEKAGK